MSDSYIRVFPADPHWQPRADRAAALVSHLTELFAGSADEIQAVFHDSITIIDAGEWMDDVFCPRCSAALGLEWFWKLPTLRLPAVDDLNVTVPCCGAGLTLPELRFDAPVGFARFEVCVTNGFRDTEDLTDEELTAAGHAVGHDVEQVLTRY